MTSDRIVKTADYGPRWRGHFVRVSSPDDLDPQLRAWLQESHDLVGLQQDIVRKVPARTIRPPNPPHAASMKRRRV